MKAETSVLAVFGPRFCKRKYLVVASMLSLASCLNRSSRRDSQ
jgi:hypothetical protein